MYLLSSVSEGYHRITGSRKVLAELRKVQGLGIKDVRTLERAFGRIGQEGDLRWKLPIYGKVIVSSATSPVSSYSGSQRVIEFPLQWFDRLAKLLPTKLLGENLSDARIFEKFGEVGSLIAAPLYLPIQATLRHGGGSAIGSVLEQIAHSEALCICIVDSDKSSPLGASGGTARTVAGFKDSTAYPQLEVMETNGRDLENALPDLFYLSRYSGHPQYKTMSTVLGQLTQVREFDVRAHVDIKDQITVRDVLLLPAGTQEHSFWTSKISVVLAAAGTSASAFPCLVTMSCPHTTASCPACIVASGNRANILDDFLDYFQSADRHPLRQLLDPSVEPEWNRLGAAIASWCLGDDRVRL
jgi:hypothetical protein